MSLESVDNVERGDGLALGVLGVGDCVADDAFEEGLEDTTGFFVDHWGEVLVCCVVDVGKGRWGRDILAEIRLTPPRRARRRMAGLVMPWMLSRRIFR